MKFVAVYWSRFESTGVYPSMSLLEFESTEVYSSLMKLSILVFSPAAVVMRRLIRQAMLFTMSEMHKRNA